MQPIFVSYHWCQTTVSVRAMTLTGPMFFCKLLLNGASHDTNIGCIRLVWAGAKENKFSFLLCAGPLNQCSEKQRHSAIHLDVRTRLSVWVTSRLKIVTLTIINACNVAYFMLFVYLMEYLNSKAVLVNSLSKKYAYFSKESFCCFL